VPRQGAKPAAATRSATLLSTLLECSALQERPIAASRQQMLERGAARPHGVAVNRPILGGIVYGQRGLAVPVPIRRRARAACSACRILEDPMSQALRSSLATSLSARREELVEGEGLIRSRSLQSRPAKPSTHARNLSLAGDRRFVDSP